MEVTPSPASCCYTTVSAPATHLDKEWVLVTVLLFVSGKADKEAELLPGDGIPEATAGQAGCAVCASHITPSHHHSLHTTPHTNSHTTPHTTLTSPTHHQSSHNPSHLNSHTSPSHHHSLTHHPHTITLHTQSLTPSLSHITLTPSLSHITLTPSLFTHNPLYQTLHHLSHHSHTLLTQSLSPITPTHHHSHITLTPSLSPITPTQSHLTEAPGSSTTLVPLTSHTSTRYRYNEGSRAAASQIGDFATFFF